MKVIFIEWGVLQYTWEEYRNTNGRSNDSIFLFSGLRGESAAVTLEAYCNTHSRCIAVSFLGVANGVQFLACHNGTHWVRLLDEVLVALCRSATTVLSLLLRVLSLDLSVVGLEGL